MPSKEVSSGLWSAEQESMYVELSNPSHGALQTTQRTPGTPTTTSTAPRSPSPGSTTSSNRRTRKSSSNTGPGNRSHEVCGSGNDDGSYPLCAGKLKDGSSCRTVVVSTKSDEPLLRLNCQHHAARAAAAVEAQPEAEPLTPPIAGGSDRDGPPVASLASSAEARDALPAESPETEAIEGPPRSETDQEMLDWPLGFRLALVNAAQRWPEDLVKKVGEIGYGYGHYLDRDGGPEAVVDQLRTKRVR